jgi:Uma2 family endonuclease
VETAPMSAYACILANILARELNFHARQLNIGQAVVEVLFHLALPVDRNRRPDLAFVSYDDWPKDRVVDPNANAWDVVPQLAVEVISPHDLAEELIEKIDEYFRSGVKLVWVVFPRHSAVHVYESSAIIRVLTRNDVLDGGKILPQFRLPLKDLFIE